MRKYLVALLTAVLFVGMLLPTGAVFAHDEGHGDPLGECEDLSCPTNQHFHAERLVCPSGYSPWLGGPYCEKNGSQFDLKLGTIETFDVTFDYGKSEDPHKCHRPTASSLGVPSWARDDFNDEFPEFIEGEVIQLEPGEGTCPNPEPVIRTVVDCEGWFVYVDDELEESGTWTDPYSLESQFSEILDEDVNEPEECLLKRGEVDVGVSLVCDRAAEDGTVYQAIAFLSISEANAATLSFGGNDYTEGQAVHVPFGSYDWSAEAEEGFVLVGDSEGTVKLTSANCNGPTKSPPTGPESSLLLPLVLMGSSLPLMAAGARLIAKRREL